MQYLFARENTDLLAQFAWARVLLGFDFDGTLAPIVADRNAAAMRAPTARLLENVCGLYSCAVLSGRSENDLINRLGQARVERVVSNLGFEAGRHDPAVARAIASARSLLQRELASVSGVDIENKEYSLAIHYRRSRRRRDARRAISHAVALLPTTLRVMPGKLVVNVVHARAPTKASAILRLRDELRADVALYVGDDASDEDVFALDQPGRLLSIRVGRSRASQAPYYLRDQSEVDQLLRALIALRAQGARTVARSM